jgi:lactose/L-arabinose transport system substrate-binding protein
VTWLAATAALGLVAGPALAADQPKGEITVWSWNIAAEALDMLVPDFNKKYPDVKVKVLNMGHNDVYTKALAGCAAGGTDLPDVVTIENDQAEVYWAKFPDCFTDLKKFGADKYKDAFPAFKWPALTVGDAIYSLPWDSGPTILFYRRDLFQQAGIDPQSMKTWDDYIAAGKKMLAATGGKVQMATMNMIDDDGWFRPLASQEGCAYFSADAQKVTINQPGCVTALDTLKKMKDAGILANGDWGGQIQNIKSSVVATAFYGGWYEGTVRSNTPEQSGKWGVVLMPAGPSGVRAANWGGSSLAIPASTKNPEAAWAYIEYALATVPGQVSMLKNRGLVPSLLAALDDPFVKAPQPFWGGQAIWSDILGTMKDVHLHRGTQFFDEVRGTIVNKIIIDYLNGKYPSAKAALDTAADQISSTTGLPKAG